MPPFPTKRKQNYQEKNILSGMLKGRASSDSTYNEVPPDRPGPAAKNAPVSPPPPLPPPPPVSKKLAMAKPPRVATDLEQPVGNVLPDALEHMDNREAWLHVRGHLLSTPGSPLVIWGATGCGKTYGVRVLLAHLFPSYSIVEMDGAEEDHISTCLSTITRARESCQRTVVFMDDFESFLPNWRTEIAKNLFGKTLPHLSPLIITCTQFRHQDNKALRSLHAIRLRAPQASTLTKFFAARYGLARVLPHRSLCAHGDVRRLQNAIALDLPQTATKNELQIAPSNMFDASRGLLLKDYPAALWSQYASSLDVALLQEHLMKHVNMQAMPMVADNFSWTDSSRFIPLQYQTLVVATTATLTSRPREVGALAPRLREARGDSRKREWADVPAILGGTICKRSEVRLK
jgi:hypothetical protein